MYCVATTYKGSHLKKEGLLLILRGFENNKYALVNNVKFLTNKTQNRFFCVAREIIFEKVF